jgi:rhodanese-related sulfurtransferase
MDRVIEFALNHPYLVGSFFALLAAFIYTEMKRGGRSITPVQLTLLVNQKNAKVIDLRNSPEFRDGHITGSESVPFSQVADKTQEFVTAGRPIIFVCSTGQVSSMAGRNLQKAGLTEVYRLAGGISGWRQAGLPLIK